jgi:raffinose/stachyose/melibiose transport system permease protein
VNVAARPATTFVAKRISIRETFGRVVLHAILIAFALFVLLPLYFAFLGSFKTVLDLFQNPTGFPTVWMWSNYSDVWETGHIGEYFIHSAVITFVAVPIQIFFSTLAAYGIARYRTPRTSFFYFFFVAGLIIPIQLIILPTVFVIQSLGLLGTYWGLILAYIGFGQPFAIFITSGFFRTLPSELEDAGRIDGANELQVLVEIMLPLARPVLAAVGIFYFVGVWNDFFLPFIISDSLPTVQMGVAELKGATSAQWGLIFAGVIISAVPLVVAYILFTEQFVSGLTAGALKG